MANSRREVWELAQQTGCDGFISKVSAIFGKDAIADVCIATPAQVCSTSDQLAAYSPYKVTPGVSLAPADMKAQRSSKK